MDKRQRTSFMIMIASLAPVSLVLQQRVASRSSKHLITRHEPMPSVNAFWGVCGESAWITCILHEKHLHRVLHASVKYFNEAQPHQGIHQQVPQGKVPSVPLDRLGDRIISVPVLGGLHHEYLKVA